MAQHRPGCSLATAEDWRPRDAAELASVRARREEAPTAEEHRAERAEPETSRGGGEDGISAEARALYQEIKAAGNVVCTLPDRSTPNVPRPVERCRPPLCHADDIHEPARVRGFARPLCERHRAWVEGAGGTVATAEDAAALHAGETV